MVKPNYSFEKKQKEIAKKKKKQEKFEKRHGQGNVETPASPSQSEKPDQSAQ